MKGRAMKEGLSTVYFKLAVSRSEFCFNLLLKLSLLDCKGIKWVNPKGNQPWRFIRRLMLKLKLQCFGHLMWRANSLETTLILGKTEGRRRRGGTEDDGIMDSMDRVWANSERQWWTGKPGLLQSVEWQRVGHDLATEGWTKTICDSVFLSVKSEK